MPLASGPHAAVWASRLASTSAAAEAVPLFCRPPKATVTEHSTRWDERVDQSKKAAKASTTKSERNLPRAVKFLPSGSAAASGLEGTKWPGLLFFSQPGARRDVARG
jgi:hypothetical protein